MLSKEEAAFIKYWEANRNKQKKVFRQFLVGIPIGLLIVIPTVISLTSGWYKRAEMEANSSNFNPMVLFVALLLIVAFSAIFYQRWKWEQYEQRYLELLAREDQESKKSATNNFPDTTARNPPADTNIPNPSAASGSHIADNSPKSTNPSTPRDFTDPNSPSNPNSPDV
jgi:hypothetical protein